MRYRGQRVAYVYGTVPGQVAQRSNRIGDAERVSIAAAQQKDGTVDDSPIAKEVYDALAASYAARADRKPHNAYYDRPATLALLPEVAGERVLDAGCGAGSYADWLLEHGADHVVACDVSPEMVRQARDRLSRFGPRAQVVCADLAQPLSFCPDDRRLIVSGLALHYVRDWASLFNEFHRLLVLGGQLVFSIEHPWVQWTDHHQGNYFAVERVEYLWRGFGQPVVVPSYRRSLQDVLTPLLDAGFVLEKVVEPRPTAQFQALAPRQYAELSRSPGFLCLRARKD